MKRFQIRANATNVDIQGNVISGLALPYGVEASPLHPAFTPGVLVDYGYTRPLLIEHDITKIAGDVVKLYETTEGVHFVAVKNTSDDFAGVSIGAEYWLDSDGNITALYIHEISLTNSPAYPTYYTIVAHEVNEQSEQTAVNPKTDMHMETKAQDLMMITQELEALRENVMAIEQRVTQLETAIAAINEKIASIDDISMAAVEASTKALDAAKEELQKHSEMLNQQVNASLTGIVETLEKLVTTIKK